jgi:serine/threonine-protein kinase
VTSPTPVPSVPSAATFAGAVQALSSVLQQQLQAGQIDPGAASDLSRQINDLAGQDPGGRGHHHDLANKINDLRSRLGNLRDDGKLTAVGFTALSTALDQVAATVPDNGNNGGDN